MLQTMRNNAQGMIAKIIMGFLIVVFALWGVESIVSLGGGESSVAEVDGQKITEADISRAVEVQKANLSRQFGSQFDESLFSDKLLRQAAIEQLVQEKVAIIQAQKLGFVSSQRVIDESIVNIPAFQVDGRFDKEQFQNVLRLNGLSALEFRNSMASENIVNQARAGFILSSIETPFSAKLNQALENEERTFRFVEIKARDLEKEIQVSADELEQRYQADLDNFRVPELVSIRYLELKRSELESQQEISQEELQQAYDQYLQRESANEQRQASHILLEVGDSRTKAQSIELANELKKRIDNGEDFAKLAKEYSDDLGSKAAGGDLGLTPRGSFDNAFETALYSLKEGGVSAPVETEFGIHLIRADKVVKQDVKSLDEMEAELTADIRQIKSRELYSDKLIEMSDLAFSAQSLDDLAKDLKLTVHESQLFSANQGEGIAQYPEIRETAFSSTVLDANEISPMIELEDSAVVMVVKEHKNESVKPLAEVKELVAANVKLEKAIEQAKEKAKAIVAGSKAKGWTSVTTAYSESSEAPSAAQQKAFAMKVGERSYVQSQGSVVVIALDKINKKNWQDIQVEEEQIEMGRLMNSRSDLVSYQSWARSASKIKQ